MNRPQSGDAQRGYVFRPAFAMAHLPRARAERAGISSGGRIGVIAMSGVVDDSPIVPVRSMLRPSTYRAFAARAKELGVDVATVLSRLADRAVASPEPRRAAPVTVGPARPPGDAIDRRIVELNAERLNDSEIAAVIGMHQTAVSRRRRLMGLVSRGRAER